MEKTRRAINILPLFMSSHSESSSVPWHVSYDLLPSGFCLPLWPTSRPTPFAPAMPTPMRFADTVLPGWDFLSPAFCVLFRTGTSLSLQHLLTPALPLSRTSCGPTALDSHSASIGNLPHTPLSSLTSLDSYRKPQSPLKAKN